jgi:hypothetical protein
MCKRFHVEEAFLAAGNQLVRALWAAAESRNDDQTDEELSRQCEQWRRYVVDVDCLYFILIFN